MFFQVTSPIRRVLSGQSQSRNVSSLIFPVRRSASIETMTFSECFMSGYIVPRPLSPLCLRLPRCPHLCRDAHRTVCSITSSLSLPCVIHFSFSFFPDQYAGQQAVRQIVCCELHQTPRSIVSELCWIHSDVFKPRQVERSQGSACEVRWGDRGEGRVRRGGGCGESVLPLVMITIIFIIHSFFALIHSR